MTVPTAINTAARTAKHKSTSIEWWPGAGWSGTSTVAAVLTPPSVIPAEAASPIAVAACIHAGESAEACAWPETSGPPRP